MENDNGERPDVGLLVGLGSIARAANPTDSLPVHEWQPTKPPYVGAIVLAQISEFGMAYAAIVTQTHRDPAQVHVTVFPPPGDHVDNPRGLVYRRTPAANSWRWPEQPEASQLPRCPRCPGYLVPKVSKDQSAWEADVCGLCNGSWWHDPPKLPREMNAAQSFAAKARAQEKP